MGWIDGWASGHNPLRSLSGAGGHHDPLRRCCFLRGDGNSPEVPVIRTVLRAYNGVWGVPIKHMSAALCAHKCRASERLCEAKYSELYPPEGALIKRWASPVCKCALPTSEDLYLDSEKGMMVLSSGRCAPVPWRRA